MLQCSFGPPEWRSSLRHCITVFEVSLQTRVLFQAVSQLAMTRRPKTQVIGPALSGLGEVLVPLRSSDSLWWAGRLQAKLDGISSDTLVRLASGLSFWLKQAVRLGVMFWWTLGSRSLPLPSPWGSCSDGTKL